jgi:hypothetical protein
LYFSTWRPWPAPFLLQCEANSFTARCEPCQL